MKTKITILDGPYTAREIWEGKEEDYGQVMIGWHAATQSYTVSGVLEHPFTPESFQLRLDSFIRARRAARFVVCHDAFPGWVFPENILRCPECDITVTDLPRVRSLYPHRKGCTLAY